MTAPNERTESARADRSQEQASFSEGNAVDVEAIRQRLEAADDPIDFEATFFGTQARNEANAHFLSHSMADIRALLADNARLQRTVDEQQAALEGVIELANEGLGVWMSVSSEYVPRALIDFADIRDVAEDALKAAARADTSANEDARTQGTPDAGGES